MKVESLIPKPSHNETFKRNREQFIPNKPGCYTLATFSNDILYVGLAKNLRRRMNEHLDNSEKTSPTDIGRATFFYWIESPDIQKIERTWMNMHMDIEGRLPLLNKIYSPISL